jgi:hypothetical protein
MFPDSLTAGVVRLSLAETPAILFFDHRQGVAVVGAEAAACPSSRNMADEPPPRNWTVCAFEALAIARNATASTPKYFANFISSPC